MMVATANTKIRLVKKKMTSKYKKRSRRHSVAVFQVNSNKKLVRWNAANLNWLEQTSTCFIVGTGTKWEREGRERSATEACRLSTTFAAKLVDTRQCIFFKHGPFYGPNFTSEWSQYIA